MQYNNAQGGITLNEFASIVREANSQAPWRSDADKAADYADGNQLHSDLLRKQEMFGIPPAKENVITPVINAVCGYEAKTRRDWRVTPDGDMASQDIADALNYRLNQAERHSKADRALSQAFRAMAVTGIGWVEVARAPSSLDYPYRCRYIHRNEIWWDMQAREPDFSDARWLLRRRWPSRELVAQLFPQFKELITEGLENWMADGSDMLDGGVSTGLLAAAEAERAWTQIEDAWYNTESKTVCLTELWYRRYAPTLLLKAGERVVKYDANNRAHQLVLQSGRGQLIEEIASQVRRSYWMGPHLLDDSESPYPHQHFPYVPLIAAREDMTGIPYGLVRDMIFPQDNINSCIAKLRWGMSVVRTERTKGAVAMSDDQYRRQIARPDADIVLDPVAMAMPGARYEVKRDFELNTQQFQLMQDSRAALDRVSGVSTAFMGQKGTATSGVQEQTQLEQSQVTLGDMMDHFQDARAMVGELLLALIIEDLGTKPHTIVIEGDTLNPPRTVQLNIAEVDPLTGTTYMSNDVQRARLQVALEDVPTTSSFRVQQQTALSEAIKSLPPDVQKVAMPFLIDLMDLPRKREVVKAIKEAQTQGQADPEAIKEQVKQELMYDLKSRELDIKEQLTHAQIKQLMAQAVQTGVQAAFSAMQGGMQVATMPQIAPIADAIMQGAGYQKPNPGGDDPNFPVPGDAGAPQAPLNDGGGAGIAQQLPEAGAPHVRQNTSPTFPPVPQQPARGMDGIETPDTGDNLPA